MIGAFYNNNPVRLQFPARLPIFALHAHGKVFPGFIKAGHFPEPQYNFSRNPVTKEGFELGKRLFYEPRFSRNNTIASGRLRLHGAGIGGSVYSPPSVSQFIEEMFDLMLYKTDQIRDPFEQAFFIMVHLPYLQPFDDVNKRVSRLAANISLNMKNLAPLSFTEVPSEIYINGLLGAYELNRIELLKDVFLWAYDRSAKQYAAQRQSLGDPDPFRLKYRNIIRELIAEIIKEVHDKYTANILIKAKAVQLPQEDDEKFIQTVEQALINLHDGNFARYFVTPLEFKKWLEVWVDSSTNA